MERVSEVGFKEGEKRTALDKAASFAYLTTAIIAASSLVLIAIFLLVKGLEPFFKSYTENGVTFRIDFLNFLFGLHWYSLPKESGILYLTINTLYVSLLATLIALPLSIYTALFISKIAPKPIGVVLAFAIELLAAIPSVVYGLFGREVICPLVDSLASLLGLTSKGGLSSLSAAIVLALMILPILTSLSANAMKNVPSSYLASSLALGASKTETYFKVIIPASRNGIFAGLILGLGRALGEATAVSSVIGNAGSGPTFDLFGTSATLTSNMLLGYSEAVGANAEIRFSIGLALILLIIAVDLLLGFVQKRMAKKYGQD
jgi:phosphate transport system permease protein